MKLHTLSSTALAMAALACAADAQQPFGPWVHDASAPLSLFVSTTGSDTNSGLDPANALATLSFAVQQADSFLSGTWPTPAAGATINVLPGTYTLTDTLRLPAFGLSIEPYWSSPASPVTITGSLSNAALFHFDHVVGPATEANHGLPSDLPPSIVRGLTFTSNGVGYAIEIDPSLNVPSEPVTRPIEVQVNQCAISQFDRGVLIRNLAGAEIEYQNVIVDNGIDACDVGIEVISDWYESDLVRSNRVSGSFTAMRFNGSNGEDGMLHPRILSNTVNDSSQLVGVALQDCSARVVNNTFAFVTAPCCNATSTTIGIAPDSGGSSGETIVIANNILFSPRYFSGTLFANPPEISVLGTTSFAGTLVVESNDFDSSGALVGPGLTAGTGNVGIANPLFVNPPSDLHLTDASPSTTNAGDQTFVVPGTPATISFNGQTLPANCALDVDLDARTHMDGNQLVDVLHRGSDQHIESLVRLRTATAGSNPPADLFGNIPVDSSGNAAVDLLLDLPIGSVWSIELGAALPMGPEMQHLVVSPFGSLAVDPTPGNGTTVLASSSPTTANPHPVTFNLGAVSPAFTEAEMYLQAVVALPSGVITFTNRIRLDVDGI